MSKALSSRPGHARPFRLRMILPVLAMAILPWAADALGWRRALSARGDCARLPQARNCP